MTFNILMRPSQHFKFENSKCGDVGPTPTYSRAVSSFPGSPAERRRLVRRHRLTNEQSFRDNDRACPCEDRHGRSQAVVELAEGSVDANNLCKRRQDYARTTRH